MKRLGDVGLQTRRLVVATLMTGFVLSPTLGMARSYFEFLRNDEDWAYSGDINLQVGQTSLADSDWEPAQDQLRYGAEIDFTNSGHWAGVVLGFSRANEEDSATRDSTDITVDSKFTDVYIGLRKVFYNLSYVRPFAGVGATLHSVDIERRSGEEKDSDSALGYGGYAEAGLYVDVYGPFHVGGSVRYSAGTVDIFDTNKDPGGLTIGAMIGLHWYDY